MIYSNIYYQEYLTPFGGMGTFLYELAHKYSNRDLTIIYGDGNEEQIKRLRKFVRCIKFNDEQIECDKAFFNYSLTIIDKVKAKEYIQIIHADFLAPYLKDLELKEDSRIQRYYAVSKNSANSFKKLTGKECRSCV